MRHANYPHFPGTLFDCPECEATCYCTPGETQCVHCAIKEETKMFSPKDLAMINRFSADTLRTPEDWDV